MIFIHFLTYIFLFRNAITKKYKNIKTIEYNLSQKVIEAKCSGNFKLKAAYTAEEKRVWRFCASKSYSIKDVINKIIGANKKRIACIKYLFLTYNTTHAQHITEVAAWCVKTVIKSL